MLFRALDKRNLVMIRNNFCEFCIIPNVVCNPSSKPSSRGSSDEVSQHMVSMRNKKNYHQIFPLI